MPVETNSNNDGSVSLYPENGAAALPTVGTGSGQKKTLFRRPFSDNSAYQPVKYSLIADAVFLVPSILIRGAVRPSPLTQTLLSR